MPRPQEVTLAEATTHIVNTCARHRRPFFFMVGAGVSYPPIPLAPHVIEACRKQCPGSEVPKDLDPMREYSWWFQRAFHSPADRQWYLRSLIEKQSVSHANLRLAHLLLSKKISNLVVTTNFDDFVSKSLTIFGEPHIICDHPDTIQRIDAENDDLQILHDDVNVHPNVFFVVPEQSSLQTRRAGAGEKLPEPTLPASEVLDALVSSFQLEAPPLTRDPLGFFAQQLRNSLPPDDAASVRPDLYLISKVIRRIERARQRLSPSAPEMKTLRHPAPPSPHPH